MSKGRQREQDDRQPSTPRVAVDVLQRDQRAILFDGDPTRQPPIHAVADGFNDRREAINWWQAAAVRTFGHLADDFPAIQLRRDDALADALYKQTDAAEAERTRTRVIECTLDACETAYRDLESRANEWLADDDGGEDYTNIDPETQQHVAMRPAFSRLDEQQAKTLDRLWGGFEKRVAVMRWAHSLPSVADFSEVLEGAGADPSEDTVPNMLARDTHALQMFQSDTDVARFYRERWAITWLLPAFATRAKRLQAGEMPSRRPDPNPWNEVRD